jgi:hypothetical protein
MKVNRKLRNMEAVFDLEEAESAIVLLTQFLLQPDDQEFDLVDA